MKKAHATLSIRGASREILRFWTALVEQVGPLRVLTASLLALLTGLSEGLTLLFLVPLLQSLDPAPGSQVSIGWLPRLLQGSGLQLSLGGVLALFLGLAATRSLLNRQSALYLTALRLKFLRDTRVGLYSAIAHSTWSFLRRKRPADLLSTLTAQTDRLDTAVYFALQMPGRAMIIASHVVAAWMIAPALTIAALGSGLMFAWLAKGRLVESLRLGETLSVSYRNYHHIASEFLSGLKIAKIYVAEERYVAAFAHSVDEVRHNLMSFTINQCNARLVQEVAGACSVAIFLWVSAGLLRLPIADVLVLALILYRLLPLVQGLQQDAQQLLHVAPAAHEVFALSQACLAVREMRQSEPRQILSFDRGLSFDNVSFKYSDKDSPVLTNVSLFLPPGSLTVLSGPSGAGKSTLLDLLAGLAKPTAGKIRIDGHELTDEGAQAWRNSVAYVLQDPFLFNATIRENMLVADLHASERELAEALSAANAAGFVEALPLGLDTVVGDRGARFSGGERQRLSLARALLRKPAILILDEPTSSLDSESERVVLSGIEALRGGLTMILVTHRPEQVKAADQVLRLEKGMLSILAQTSTVAQGETVKN